MCFAVLFFVVVVVVFLCVCFKKTVSCYQTVGVPGSQDVLAFRGVSVPGDRRQRVGEVATGD